MTPALVAAVAIAAALALCYIAGYAAAERHHYARTAVLRRRLAVALATVERRRTGCPQGHAWTEANTYHHLGSRSCRECNRIRSITTRARKRAA